MRENSTCTVPREPTASIAELPLGEMNDVSICTERGSALDQVRTQRAAGVHQSTLTAGEKRVRVQIRTNLDGNPRGLDWHKMPPVPTSRGESTDGRYGQQGPPRGKQQPDGTQHARCHDGLTVFEQAQSNVLPYSTTIVVERKIRGENMLGTTSLAG